jgi:hypothetical protein
MKSFLLAAVLALSPLAHAAGEAEAQAERMLAALGGRAAWAAAKNTVNDSRQDWDGDPSELRVVISMDFERPRIRIETWGRDLHVVRVVDGERDWRMMRDGKVVALAPELRADDLKFYAGHVYRTLHRLARRDAALSLAIGAEGRLEVREGCKRIAWYLLDRRGAPYRFGAHDDDTGSIFGPWTHEVAGIRHPAWVTRENGKWRAMLNRLEVNAALDERTFARPPG